MISAETIENIIPKDSPLSLYGNPVKISDAKNEVMALSYEPTDKYLAIGYFNGAVKLYSPFSGKQQCYLNDPSNEDVLKVKYGPVSCIRWKPQENKA